MILLNVVLQRCRASGAFTERDLQVASLFDIARLRKNTLLEGRELKRRERRAPNPSEIQILQPRVGAATTRGHPPSRSAMAGQVVQNQFVPQRGCIPSLPFGSTPSE